MSETPSNTVREGTHVETLMGAPDTPWMGSLREEYDSIESTQTRAVELLRQGKVGAIVSARQQTGGMGRLGRAFWSPEDIGVYVSVTLPHPPSDRFQLLSLWAGVTILRAIREAGVVLNPVPINLTKRLSLKWPNDILLDGKKIAGILLTAVTSGYTPLGAVLGIGLNLNIDAKQFPAELKGKATSIKMATGTEWEREMFIQHILSVIERMWVMMSESPEHLLSEWLRWGPEVGTQMIIHDFGDSIEGRFHGLNMSGELILELPDGKLTEYVSGVVEYRNV